MKLNEVAFVRYLTEPLHSKQAMKMAHEIYLAIS